MTIEEVSVRLKCVERENWRIRAGGLVALVLVAGVAVIGQAAAPEKVVQAERFEVVDGAGKIRATFGTIQDGCPVILLRDRNGEVRALLTAPTNGIAGLHLKDGRGVLRASLSVFDDGSPRLSLSGDDGELRASLCVLGRGIPRLSLRDKGEVVRATLNAEGLALSDEMGRTRAVLGVTELGTGKTGIKERTESSSLVLLDKDGRVIEKFPK